VICLIEHEPGIATTYFFRVVPESFDAPVMRRLHELGHEVGYHYECMDVRSLPRKGYNSDDERWAAMVDMAYENADINPKLQFFVCLCNLLYHIWQSHESRTGSGGILDDIKGLSSMPWF
jgi:hypothetical protein